MLLLLVTSMVPSSNSWKMKSGIKLTLLSSFLLLLKLLRGSRASSAISLINMLNMSSVILSCVILYFVWILTLLKLLFDFHFLKIFSSEDGMYKILA